MGGETVRARIRHPDNPIPALKTLRIARDVVVLAWENGHPSGANARRLRVTRGEETLRPPYAHTELPLADGGWRSLLAVRLAEGAGSAAPLAVCADDARVVAAEGGASIHPVFVEDFDAIALLAGANPAGRVRCSRFVLDVCASLFGLGADSRFIATARDLLAELNPNPPPMHCRAAVLGGHVLCEARVPAGLGERLGATVLGVSVRRASFAPAAAAIDPGATSRTIYLLLERDRISPSCDVVFFGEGGAACRRLRAPTAPLPPILGWLKGDTERFDAARRYLIESLAGLARDEGEASALLRALALYGRSSQGLRLGDWGNTIAAGADLLLGCEAGLFIAGWLHDPHHLVNAIEVTGAGGAHRLALDQLGHYARRAADPANSGNPAAGHDHGFVALIREPGPAQAWLARRLALALPSGHRRELSDQPVTLPPAAARAAVLASVAGQDLGNRLIEDHLEPAVRALDEALVGSAAKEPAEVVAIAAQPARPAVSIVLSLGADDAVVRCQLALLAMDWPAIDAELLLVAGPGGLTPEDRSALRGLVTAFGLSARLVVPADDACAATALNSAVGLARAPLVAFLGAGIVPEAPGWLARLGTFLADHPECVIAGARLIEGDHALLDAGTEIAIGDGGAWIVAPRFRGYPRDFLPAALSGPVPVASRRCLLTRKAFFLDAGGFSPAFLSAPYADADLCFKARTTGGSVWHLSDPTLFALDAVGAPAASGEDPIATLLDQRCLARLWRDRLYEPEPVDEPEPADEFEPADHAVAPMSAVTAACPVIKPKSPRKRRRRQEEAA